jgi:hypothetical protein
MGNNQVVEIPKSSISDHSAAYRLFFVDPLARAHVGKDFEKRPFVVSHFLEYLRERNRIYPGPEVLELVNPSTQLSQRPIED